MKTNGIYTVFIYIIADLQNIVNYNGVAHLDFVAGTKTEAGYFCVVYSRAV